MSNTRPRSISLGNQLIFWFLFLSLLPLVLVSWISYQQANSSLTRAASDELELSAQLNIRYIQNWFSYRFSDLNAQSANKNNSDLLIQLTTLFENSGQPLNQFTQSDKWLQITNTSQHDLDNLSQYYDYIFDIFLIDQQGNILYTVAGESDLGTNLFTGPLKNTRFSKSVQKTLTSGQDQFSDLEHYDPSNQLISGFLSSPLKNSQGDIIGAYAVQIKLNQLFDLLHNELSNNVKHYLVGADGLLRTPLSNSEDEVLNKVISTVQYQLWRTDEVINQTPSNHQHGTAFKYEGPDQQSVIGLHNNIQIANTQWVLISEINEDIALASAHWLGNVVMLLVTLTGLIVVVIAVYQTRRITRPIIALSKASMAVAAGEKKQHVDIEINNEIGQLAEAFNHMLAMRQEHEQTIEQSHFESQQALTSLADQRFALDQHAIVTITDAKGIITYANSNFAKTSGYTIEEITGQTHQLIRSGYHEAGFYKNLYKTITAGNVWHGEVCDKAKDGHLYWNDTTIVPFIGHDGQPKSYIAIRTDITQRKKAELATQQTLTLLEATLESTDNGILVTNKEGKALQINSRFADLWRIPPELIKQGDEKAMLKYVTKQLANPKQFFEGAERLQKSDTQEVQDTLDFKDGRVYERITRPMLHEGVIQGRVWSFRDITERVKTEQTLLDAKNAAEAAVEAKGEFLASMSHEIRTPMNGVLGMLRLLINSKLSEKQRHKALLAQSSAQSLLALINDILDFSKVDAGKIELEFMDFNLRTLLGDFAEAMALKAQEKNIELVLDVANIEQSTIKGDPGRLRQVLTNIVANAIKFTHTGEVIITAGIKELSNNNVIFYCSVKDSGIGIPRHKLPTLFDPFTQVDASTTRKYGGTGLGLSIVKKLCELMGGSVCVASEPKKGTCFEFTLHFETSKNSVPVIPNLNEQALSILVVDDNNSNRQVLVKQLSKWGAEVVDTESGAEALTYLNHLYNQPDHRPVDLILIDMQMPEMNGEALGKAIRSHKQFDSIKLVMMTSMGHRGDANYFSDLGFSAHFPKPATTLDLFNALSAASHIQTPVDVSHHSLHSPSQHQNGNTHHSAPSNATKWPDNTRLLLVEDNHVNQEVALGVLENMGLQADIAGDGLEALYALEDAPKDNPYTLILMDCQMPEMDGYAASQNIRAGEAGERNQSIPIIAMTANAMKGDKEKCLQAGMSDYLSKPIEPDGLYAMMEKWLQVQEDDNTQTPIEDTVPPFSDAESSKALEETINESTLEAWDKTGALRRLGGRDQLLNKLIGLFLGEASSMIVHLEQAVDAEDIDNTRTFAHTLKGSAANIGAIQLQEASSKLEQAASHSECHEFKTHFSKVDNALAVLKLHLEEYQNEFENK